MRHLRHSRAVLFVGIVTPGARGPALRSLSPRPGNLPGRLSAHAKSGLRVCVEPPRPGRDQRAGSRGSLDHRYSSRAHCSFRNPPAVNALPVPEEKGPAFQRRHRAPVLLPLRASAVRPHPTCVARRADIFGLGREPSLALDEGQRAGAWLFCFTFASFGCRPRPREVDDRLPGRTDPAAR